LEPLPKTRTIMRELSIFLDLEKSALAQAQTAGIDRGQARPIHRKTNRGQNPVKFLWAQEHRQLLVFGRT
jgi:hypothetical protein